MNRERDVFPNIGYDRLKTETILALTSVPHLRLWGHATNAETLRAYLEVR